VGSDFESGGTSDAGSDVGSGEGSGVVSDEVSGEGADLSGGQSGVESGERSMNNYELIEKIIETFNNALVDAKTLSEQEDWEKETITLNAMDFCIDEILANKYIEKFLEFLLKNDLLE